MIEQSHQKMKYENKVFWGKQVNLKIEENKTFIKGIYLYLKSQFLG